MSINNVIERKQRKAVAKKGQFELRAELVNEFISFVEETKLLELNKVFPSVVISKPGSSSIVSVAYSPSRIAGYKHHTMGASTYNVVLSSTKDQFNIGYGANSAGGSKEIPFDFSALNKTKKKKLFKEIIKCLVSEAYWVGYENNREHQVWKGYERPV